MGTEEGKRSKRATQHLSHFPPKGLCSSVSPLCSSEGAPDPGPALFCDLGVLASGRWLRRNGEDLHFLSTAVSHARFWRSQIFDRQHWALLKDNQKWWLVYTRDLRWVPRTKPPLDCARGTGTRDTLQMAGDVGGLWCETLGRCLTKPTWTPNWRFPLISPWLKSWDSFLIQEAVWSSGPAYPICLYYWLCMYPSISFFFLYLPPLLGLAQWVFINVE